MWFFIFFCFDVTRIASSLNLNGIFEIRKHSFYILKYILFFESPINIVY